MKLSSLPAIAPPFLLYILYFSIRFIGVFIIGHEGYSLLERNNSDSLLQSVLMQLVFFVTFGPTSTIFPSTTLFLLFFNRHSLFLSPQVGCFSSALKAFFPDTFNNLLPHFIQIITKMSTQFFSPPLLKQHSVPVLPNSQLYFSLWHFSTCYYALYLRVFMSLYYIQYCSFSFFTVFCKEDMSVYTDHLILFNWYGNSFHCMYVP